ncbi:unnamed protein product [Linum trigynum]|uniref:Uncharacterized protein n=1 Tax=Linum trigynum TaxID=586398 RepID=A0AAV2E3Z5_9ROSI
MLAGWSRGVVELIGGGRDGTELRAEASWVATGRSGGLQVAAGSRRHVAERREATSNERRSIAVAIAMVRDSDGRRQFTLLSRERSEGGGRRQQNRNEIEV